MRILSFEKKKKKVLQLITEVKKKKKSTPPPKKKKKKKNKIKIKNKNKKPHMVVLSPPNTLIPAPCFAYSGKLLFKITAICLLRVSEENSSPLLSIV